MKIKKYLHATLLITDLEKSDYFYGHILGLKKAERNLDFPGIWYQIEDIQVHLIVVDKMPIDLVNKQKLGRNRHLAFAVEDLESAKQRLSDHNCLFEVSGSGRTALFTQDPDGNIIELTA
jgi:glyoxylase I family protein